jgi:hypothetical protein
MGGEEVGCIARLTSAGGSLLSAGWDNLRWNEIIIWEKKNGMGGSKSGPTSRLRLSLFLCELPKLIENFF